MFLKPEQQFQPTPGQAVKDIIARGYRRTRGAFVAVGAISCVVSLLMLTGPLFMLQVYDRVLASRSVPTLVALAVLVCGLYAMMGLFDFLRSRILSRVAQWLDNEWSGQAFKSWLVRSLSDQSSEYRPERDIAILRGFMSSPLMIALFDLPWFPIFLGVVFMLHFELGLLASIGALVVVCLAILSEITSGKPSTNAAQSEFAEARFVERMQNNADTVVAMGMIGDTVSRWKALHDRTLHFIQRGTERSEFFTAFSKSFRMLLQSLMLGFAAYLAIQGEISPGMIVAASIIAGRALAPLDQVVGGWRTIKRARLANKRLSDYLSRDGGPAPVTVRLPDPKAKLDVIGVTKYAPGSNSSGQKRAILDGVSFTLGPGDGLGIIGPSASGKSSLARVLVGLWMPDHGSVRFDGATFEQWDADEIGKFVGYLPQQVELLPGTIAQNIARFRRDASNVDIVNAAKIAGVHDIILSFPDGYGTPTDSPMSPLTGGYRQRIGLARAVFGMPPLVVLDEPNSNLDAEGDQALASAIMTLRENGSAVVVMAHRPSAIAAVDKILMLKNGSVLDIGDKTDVLRRVTKIA